MSFLVVPDQISLLEFLVSQFPDSSRSTLRQWMREGRVEVDGLQAIQASRSLRKGAKVRLLPTKRYLPGGLSILYEDEHLVVVDKPAGLLSVDKDHGGGQSVHSLLKKERRVPVVYPVHRLDRDTSGLLIFAFSKKARERLSVQFEQRLIEKTYGAIVHGVPAEAEGEMIHLLWERPDYHVLEAQTDWEKERAKEAITRYKLVKKKGRYAFLQLFPITGKKHQLRVQCALIGCPIVGDDRYGKADRAKRFYLHAQSLAFVHPETEKKMYFSSSLPTAFLALLPL